MKHRRSIVIAMLIALILVPTASYAQNADDTFTVGLWSFFNVPVFIDAMTELGYIEGENITYLYNQEGPDDLETAQALVDADVDVIITTTDSTALPVMELTSEIPVVFVLSDDPVVTGAVNDLVTPGRNATGIVTNRPHERRFQLLREVNPDTDKVYFLYSPTNEEYLTIFENIQEIAGDLNIEVEIVTISDVASGMDMLDNVAEGVDWFFMTPFISRDVAFREALYATAAAKQVAISEVVNTAIPGVVMGYGPDVIDATLQAASITDRILRGANPADLPIQPAENFLTINLEAAEAIGLNVPRGLLRQADLIVRPGFFEELASSTDTASS
jgi:putative tryptophan/tyrosine transport system substrate-binding protein